MPPRSLLYEQLEQKLSPSGLLLALAPLDESEQADLEEWFASDRSRRTVEASWRFEHDTTQLLRFVEQNTTPDVPASRPLERWADEAEERSDTWLQLTETRCREAVMAQAIHWINDA